MTAKEIYYLIMFFIYVSGVTISALGLILETILMFVEWIFKREFKIYMLFNLMFIIGMGLLLLTIIMGFVGRIFF